MAHRITIHSEWMAQLSSLHLYYMILPIQISPESFKCTKIIYQQPLNAKVCNNQTIPGWFQTDFPHYISIHSNLYGAHNAPLQNESIQHNYVACVLPIATIYDHVASECPAGQFITNSYNYLHTIIPRRRTQIQKLLPFPTYWLTIYRRWAHRLEEKKEDSKQTELYYPAAVTHAAPM